MSIALTQNFVLLDGSLWMVTPGWGQLEGKISVGSVEQCTATCQATTECCSVEYSSTEKFCNLNRDCAPSAQKYKDYLYCSKKDTPKPTYTPTTYTSGYPCVAKRNCLFA